MNTVAYKEQLEIKSSNVHWVSRDSERFRRSIERTGDSGIIILCAAAIIISFFLSVEEDAIYISGFEDHPLPESCLFKRITGIECPTCGLTRSFVSVSHFQLRRALRFNQAGVLVYLMILLQIPYRVYIIVKKENSAIDKRIELLSKTYLYLVILVLIVLWLYRLLNAIVS